MSAKKSPLARTTEEHGSKEKLVDTLVSLLGSIQPSDKSRDDLKASLLAVSNKKLLRLHTIGSTVKEKFGTLEKLAEETARTLGRSKDAPYVAKLKTLSTGRLFDLFTTAQKRAKQAAKAA